MPCYFPITMYRGEVNPATGKRVMTMSRTNASSPIPLSVPCGRCIGCRLERRRVWSLRCMHEKSISSCSSFVTLTYSPECLPAGETLVRSDPQLFIKRLRNAYGRGIRFFGCGEYGSHTFRPHYHLLLFNVDFRDSRRFHKYAPGGEALYTSKKLDDIWENGHCVIGDVTTSSAAYVAGYCVQKVTGPEAAAYYGGRLPEFGMMSNRPGIGAGWADKYKSMLLQHDSIVMDGKESAPGRYYDLKMAEACPDDPTKLHQTHRWAEIKRERLAGVNAEDNTHARRRVRERVVEINANRSSKKGI